MDHRSVLDTSVVRLHGTASSDADDVLAVEEPLAIQVRREGDGEWTSLSVTMRTPGNDDELAAGFILGEAIVRQRSDIVSVESWGPLTGELRVRNIVRVVLADATAFDACQLRRNFYTTSSCGVCGKASLEAIDAMRPPQALDDREMRLDAEGLHQWPARLRERQEVFGSTGGLHAAALFTSSGECLTVREDVGRHNATDKLTGHALLNQIEVRDKAILVSGRASFELVQKALMAGVPVLAAVGAPSSLAVQLARAFGMTLVGFLRDGRCNVYSGVERIVTS
jgi:FdhD protein